MMTTTTNDNNRLCMLKVCKEKKKQAKDAFVWLYSVIGIHGKEVKNPSCLRVFNLNCQAPGKRVFIILVASRRQT